MRKEIIPGIPGEPVNPVPEEKKPPTQTIQNALINKKSRHIEQLSYPKHIPTNSGKK